MVDTVECENVTRRAKQFYDKTNVDTNTTFSRNKLTLPNALSLPRGMSNECYHK
jgi:hypothetical protein